MKAPAKSVSAWLTDGRKYLAQREVPEVDANLEFLMAHVLGRGRADVAAASSRELLPKQGNHFWELVKERGRRFPLAFVLGSQPFMGLDIKVSRSVLIPRPETEQLVEAVIAAAKDLVRPAHIIEIGTGTGCVPIALAKHLPTAVLYATEISPAAMAVAQENARAHSVSHRIRFLREDLFKPHAQGAPWADIIVSNPPYIPTAELETLEAEVRREPFLALDGGPDGLEAIRAIAQDAPRLLKPGGRLLMEFGDGQGSKVRQILKHEGFVDIHIVQDLQGHERIATAELAAK
jgi:release factor glutamine methyltransferase